MSHCNTLTEPIKNTLSTNTIYGKYRIILAKIVRDILNKQDINWFIESGTLLGAWRNNKLLEKDDDFDMAIIIENETYLDDRLDQLNTTINNLLPDGYKSRIVNSYCHKLEIYEEKYGKYILDDPKYNGADFHHVTVDLQVYCLKDNIVYTVEVLDKTDAEIKSDKLIKVRVCRNNLLNESDGYVTIDRWETYSDEQKTAWRQYRQSLRDIPQNANNPDNITWPIKPN